MIRKKGKENDQRPADTGDGRPRLGRKFLRQRNFSRRKTPPGSDGWMALRGQESLERDAQFEILLVHNEPNVHLVLEIIAYLEAVHRTVRVDTLAHPDERGEIVPEEFRYYTENSTVLLYLHTENTPPSPRVAREIALYREIRGEDRIGIMPLRGDNGSLPSCDGFPWLEEYPLVGVDQLAWFVRRFVGAKPHLP